MAAYLQGSFGPEIQARELADPRSIFLIAELEAVVVGYAQLYAARQVDVGGENPVELVRIYALQDWIGQGIGASLMKACLDEAIRGGHDLVWLGVWEKNPRAIHFYRRWGFEVAGSQIFQLGRDPQNDWLMRLKLKGMQPYGIPINS